MYFSIRCGATDIFGRFLCCLNTVYCAVFISPTGKYHVLMGVFYGAPHFTGNNMASEHPLVFTILD